MLRARNVRKLVRHLVTHIHSAPCPIAVDVKYNPTWTALLVQVYVKSPRGPWEGEYRPISSTGRPGPEHARVRFFDVCMGLDVEIVLSTSFLLIVSCGRLARSAM